MTQCTAPVRGHRSPKARRECPVCGKSSIYNSPKTFSPYPAVYSEIARTRPATNTKKISGHSPQVATSKTSRTVQWLIEHPTHLEQMEWIAEQINEISEALLQEYGPQYQGLTHHLWCDILAALASALEETLKTADFLIDATAENLANYVCELVVEARNDRAGASRTFFRRMACLIKLGQKNLDEVILKQATKIFIKKIFQKFTLDQRTAIEALLFQVRVLALMFCPAPEKHHAVWKSCAVPILGEQITGNLIEEINELKQLVRYRGGPIVRDP